MVAVAALVSPMVFVPSHHSRVAFIRRTTSMACHAHRDTVYNGQSHKLQTNLSVLCYVILAQVVLQSVQSPISQALSEGQAGSRKQQTTSQQVMGLLTYLHTQASEPYIRLLDMAEAFPSTPHPAIWTAICIPSCNSPPQGH